MDLDIYAPVYDFVRTVPPGKVVTYGQVAEYVHGVRLSPREVGTAMRYAPADVPWQRVVGADGVLPIGKRSAELHLTQRRLLKAEGVRFAGPDENRIDMAAHQWRPAGPASVQETLF